MDPPHFLPLNANISGQSRPNMDEDTKYLMESQAKYVYKKVEKGDLINVEMVWQEMEQEIDKIDDTNKEIHLYCDIIVNKAEKDDTLDNNPDKLKETYLDMYEGIQSKILSPMGFDENSDLSKTYLGKVHTTRASKMKEEGKFPISEQGYAVGKPLDGTECQILLDTGASKSFMSKSHYMHCKSLHSLPKF